MRTTYEQERVGDFINTYTGNRFYISDPKPTDINVIDVAHSLSNLARFAGHAPRFYSVGEHSLICLEIARALKASPLRCLYALLHDASESVMVDLPRPIKQILPCYKELEDKVMSVMWDALNLPHPTEEDYKFVKKIDNTMIILEMNQLMDKDYDVDSLEHFIHELHELDESVLFLDLEYYEGLNGVVKEHFLESYKDLMTEFKATKEGIEFFERLEKEKNK